MRPTLALLAAPIALAALAEVHDASACGGCFVSQSESTQVTGHRMVLSVSTTATTLWDQISYQGNPESFAWVLPINGVADIGLSSDLLFEALAASSVVSINSPQITCPPPPDCGGDLAAGSSDTTTGTGGGGSGVEVVAHEVVGPYETVQLSSQDPNALQDWLTTHGYAVPAEMAPVIGAYVQGGFDFLALKLVPGQGIDAMRPVRITTPGASPALPLRMVAAGTGAKTAISLWVFGEGRYEPANFPSFTIAQDDLVWDWTAQSSNYSELAQAQFAASGGKAWLVDVAEPFGVSSLGYTLSSQAEYDPYGSGYADEQGQGAVEAAQADVAALLGGMSESTVWITRMYSELSRAALATDLGVQAASDQSVLNRYLNVTKSKGSPPACPSFPPCNSGPDDDAAGLSSGGGACATGSDTSSPAGVLSLFGLVAAAATVARRRRRR